MSNQTLASPAEAEDKSTTQPSVSAIRIALFPARAFLALGWMRAGVEKLISIDWWTGAELRSFVSEHADTTLPIISPLAGLITPVTSVALAAIVLVAEFAIGIGLLTGRRLKLSLAGACALNIAFVAFGAVTPSAFYLVLQMTLLFAIARKPVPPSREFGILGVAGGIAVAIAMAPMISTLHPAKVIEDPAIMLATLGLLAGATIGFQAFVPEQPADPLVILPK